MFWSLYLAHLLVDYPLQTDRMVHWKRTWYGLLLHVGLHLLVMLVLVGTARTWAWPYLLLLTAIHYGIDTLKNLIGKYRPHRVVAPYFFDQLLHLLSVVGIALWGAAAAPAHASLPDTPWMIYAVGYLLATYVWFISERLSFHREPVYHEEIVAQLWPRMVVRALLVTLFLWLLRPLSPSVVLLAFTLPYLNGSHRRRALFTDLAVSLVVAWLMLQFV